MQGRNYTEVAARTGVSRKTLYNWVNKDPLFKSAMEAWRQRVLRSAHDYLTQSTAALATPGRRFAHGAHRRSTAMTARMYQRADWSNILGRSRAKQ